MSELHSPNSHRQHWMSVLAKSAARDVAARAAKYGDLPPYTFLRPPEQGAVMVRGRAGGDGEPFCLGEMTVTRCAVQLSDGTVGHAYVQGRDSDHATLAAVMDALAQDQESNERVMRTVIHPLEASLRARREQRERSAARTKVDFFTLVRGENLS